MSLEILPAKWGKAKKAITWKNSKDLEKLKKLLKEWKEKFKNRVKITDVKNKVKERISHIMKIEWKTDKYWKKYFNWVHSRKAIYDYEAKNWKWSARIVQDDPNADTWNKPYNAKVFAKDSNWNEVMKSFWQPEWTSTFFPDWWSKKRILEEVEYAVKHNSGKAIPNWTPREQNIYKWISKSWIEINFVLVNWKIKTFYPIIK